MGGSLLCAWGEVDLISNFTPSNLYQKARCMRRFVPAIESQGRTPYLFEVKTIVHVLGICMLKRR